MSYGTAKVNLDDRWFWVDFEYNTDHHWSMKDCWITEVTMISRSGDNERKLKDFSKLEKELEHAVKDIHDCDRDDEESDYGEWHGPDFRDVYESSDPDYEYY